MADRNSMRSYRSHFDSNIRIKPEKGADAKKQISNVGDANKGLMDSMLDMMNEDEKQRGNSNLKANPDREPKRDDSFIRRRNNDNDKSPDKKFEAYNPTEATGKSRDRKKPELFTDSGIRKPSLVNRSRLGQSGYRSNIRGSRLSKQAGNVIKKNAPKPNNDDS